jgi:hypothetical protein
MAHANAITAVQTIVAEVAVVVVTAEVVVAIAIANQMALTAVFV